MIELYEKYGLTVEEGIAPLRKAEREHIERLLG